jgi:UDP-glucose 4-epimerase
MSKKIIVLTGATGFVGSAIAAKIECKELRLISRCDPKIPNTIFCKEAICKSSNYQYFLQNSDVVIHSAARVHVMKDLAQDPLAEFRAVNVEGTLNLARQAAEAGVKRFIFLSTIKVLGEDTVLGKPFTNDDRLDPQDPYSVSKAEAEIGLREIGQNSDMDIVIIRPPLVYGAGVKGNFSSLLKLVRLAIPLPLGDIENKRSFVSIENLVDLVVTCLDHPNAKNKSFLVSDDRDLSTPDLLSMIAKAGGRKPWIFKCPLLLLSIFLRLLGKSAVYERLCGSMQVNIEDTKSVLSWNPPCTVEDALANC